MPAILYSKFNQVGIFLSQTLHPFIFLTVIAKTSKPDTDGSKFNYGRILLSHSFLQLPRWIRFLTTLSRGRTRSWKLTCSLVGRTIIQIQQPLAIVNSKLPNNRVHQRSSTKSTSSSANWNAQAMLVAEVSNLP